MPKADLHYLMYRDPVYLAVVRLVGYDGITLKDAAAKADDLVKDLSEKLPLRNKKEIQHRIMTAVYDLTRADKRQQEDSRYELTAEVRKMARGILGVAPEEPLADYWKHGPASVMGEEAMRE